MGGASVYLSFDQLDQWTSSLPPTRRSAAAATALTAAASTASTGHSQFAHFYGKFHRAVDILKGGQTLQAKLRVGLRVGHVHITSNGVVPLRNTNRSYT